jgi:hypothetical protein
VGARRTPEEREPKFTWEADDIKIVESGPQGKGWGGYEWSEWWLVDAAKVGQAPPAPTIAGIYRVRDRDGDEALLYIGQSISLRKRLRELRVGMAEGATGAKRTETHVAGGCVQQHVARGALIEVSWIELPESSVGSASGWESRLI